MEKSLVTTLRVGIVSGLALPFCLAGLAAAATSREPPMDVIAPIVALAVLVSLACWSRVIARWRDPDGPDDDDPWRHGGGPDDSTPPDGSSGGPAIDWTAFERDFAAYVEACERLRQGVLVALSAARARQGLEADLVRGGGGHRPVQAGELPEPVRGLSQSSARH
ncbi:MAG TPA: hypothetical protein VHW96_17060 [Solirubrobacteraceae bacterium]|nr:hypothetical protein [Solirubrobacteraceae bacterium]